MTRRQLLLLAAAAAGARVARAYEPAPGELRRVYIQPLGAALAEPDVALVEAALLAFYAVALVRLDAVALPRAAFYPPRGRYRAERLLDFLEQKRPRDGYRILGITGVDISTTKGPYEDWGVMGLGSLDGATCVLSSFRCRRGATGPPHARIRFAKTAVHELGHTFGVPHCKTPGCIMEDGQGTVFTTDHEYDLCPESRARLVASGHAPATAGSSIPWPKPR
jgi:archaemetzincin